jgi:hypothetical protein
MDVFFNVTCVLGSACLIFLCYKNSDLVDLFLHQLKLRNFLIIINLRQVEPLHLYYIIMFDITEEKCDIVYQDLNRNSGSDWCKL